ncbi:NAD-dependent epimerase/dehydratase family protein [Fundicoccus sp. Sow4_F4]|uniref:NAD-dependent epimerase/dehydratase family protein n=1 Tax=Fundicoccus sp. Sow4_F4 TaxID=3438783 RepID=UPI003F904D84
MKKILITGVNSFIGNSLEAWLAKHPDAFAIEKISLKNDDWKRKVFSQYDSIVHVAGIAHVSSDENLKEEYYRVNRDLTIDLAKKAKADGVKQFIFMSSIIIYGASDIQNGIITRETVPKAKDFYGDSKIQAEAGLNKLESPNFRIAIIRPPMSYGKGSKGNYPKLAKLATKIPFFPNLDNKRSMIHVDNLSEFIRLLIVNEEEGVFFPQNQEYVQTSQLVRLIAQVHGKRNFQTKLFNPIIKRLLRINTIQKIFGDYVYDQSMSDYHKGLYQVYNLKESIELTEK